MRRQQGNGDGLHLRAAAARGRSRREGSGPARPPGGSSQPLQGRPPPPPRPRQAAVRCVLVVRGPRAAPRRRGSSSTRRPSGSTLPLHRLLSRHQPGPLDRGHARRALEPADLYSCHLKVVDVGSGTSFTTLGIVKHVNPKNVTLV
ncbi:hypothetical protein PVAP13_5NG610901 [Panicum virgatum]|uniref:Uncharacterized protein n=1 Tax=Panicum virgatum TaxID=38727 RepID=A0A8T0SBD8_PANVG|nr:hypothetical protein PVAP13_5NG610901 [Panicum virgatum]